MVLCFHGMEEVGVRFPVGPPLRSSVLPRSFAVRGTFKFIAVPLLYKSEVVPRGVMTEWGYIYCMYYVYILQSKKDESRYIGVTTDLRRRFEEHNSGNARYSSTKRPYLLKWYSAFTQKQKAYEFEQYLKSSSGYAFTKKHFL